MQRLPRNPLKSDKNQVASPNWEITGEQTSKVKKKDKILISVFQYYDDKYIQVYWQTDTSDLFFLFCGKFVCAKLLFCKHF